MASEFIWYDLMTTDAEAAKAFYQDVVGWKAQDAGHPDVAYTLLGIEGYESHVCGLMQLTEDMCAQNIPPHWMGYVDVEDVDAKAAEFKAAGGNVLMEPHDIQGVGRFAVVSDPQGAAISVFTPIPPEGGMPEFPPRGTPGTAAWRELYTSDPEAAVTFYGKMFGWKPSQEVDMGPMGKYHLFAGDSDDLGGMMRMPDGMPTPAWSYYFQVDGLNAAIERVKAGGGQLLNGPMDVPDGAVVAQFLDPQGAYFCLVSMKR